MSKPVKEALSPALDRLRLRAAGKEVPVPIPWPSWAKVVGGGLFPGLYAMVGGTGIGKTQLVVEWANYAATLGHPTCYIGLEMNASDLAARLLSMYSGKMWSDYIMGKIHEEELEKDIITHWGTVEGLPLRTAFAPPHGWDYEQLASETYSLVDAHSELVEGGKTPLVVLDYLQLVSSGNPSDSTRERISRAGYLGRAIASNLNAVVLMISSTSRSNYDTFQGKKDKDSGLRPWQEDPNFLVGSGKESGDLEYAVDGLFVGIKEPKTSNVHIGAAKFRLGKPSWITMHFDGCKMHEGPGKVTPPSIQDGKLRALSQMLLNPKKSYSPTLFAKLTGLGDGDAMTARAELLQEELITIDPASGGLRIK